MIMQAQHIAAAMEQYGVSAVSDVIVKMGSSYEIVALMDIEAAIRLLRIARFETDDEITFREKQ